MRSERKLDVDSPASLAYLAFLENWQNQHVATIEQSLGRALEIRFRYQAAINGIAAAMSEAEAAKIELLPGVKSVRPDRLDPLDTDAGPTWIGTPTIWTGSSTGALGSTRGEGIVIGVVDSG